MINLCLKCILNNRDLLAVLVDHLLKTKKELRNLNANYIFKNELDKACLQHDMVYGDFKDLMKRTASDKVLRDNAFNIAKNPKYDGYQRELPSMVFKFFDNKMAGGGINIEIKPNEKLAEELHKPIIRKFKI